MCFIYSAKVEKNTLICKNKGNFSLFFNIIFVYLKKNKYLCIAFFSTSMNKRVSCDGELRHLLIKQLNLE
jgi:hypothetical protein